MRVLPAAFVLVALSTGAAIADPCDTLIDSTNSALSAPGISADVRTQLESILNAGKAAKASGDLAACEAAMTSTTDGIVPKMSTPDMGGPGGHRCSKSLNTV